MPKKVSRHFGPIIAPLGTAVQVLKDLGIVGPGEAVLRVVIDIKIDEPLCVVIERYGTEMDAIAIPPLLSELSSSNHNDDQKSAPEGNGPTTSGVK